MRTIKTKDAVKESPNKSVNLFKRMKDAFMRTKDRAEETQNTQHDSPAEYATDNVQDTAQGVTENTVQRFSSPAQTAREKIGRTKELFQKAKSQMPTARRQAAEQAQKTAQGTADNARWLRRNADQAGEKAWEAKEAVKDAKENLREVRKAGRQTMREIKPEAARGKEPPRQPPSPRQNANMAASSSPGYMPKEGVSRPTYLNRGVTAAKNTGEAAKPIKSTTKGIKQTVKGKVKTVKKSVKTAEQSAKTAVKTTQQAAKTAQKTAQVTAKSARTAEKAARAAAIVAKKTAKAAAKAVISMVRAIISAMQGLVAILTAGGLVAVLVILLVCMIGMFVGSVFSIFFSSEPSHETGQTINGVITEIDADYSGRIDAIISVNAYDLLDMSEARAAWKEVLAIYTVRTVADPDNPMEVATMNNEKAVILRSVFWEMNTVSHWIETVERSITYIDEKGNKVTYTWNEDILYIIVTHKTLDKMAAKYRFTDEQKEWLEELLKPEHDNLWNSLLYGIVSVDEDDRIMNMMR